MRSSVKNALSQPGAHVIVDGQYGSTGKGAIAAYLAGWLMDDIDIVTSNAGPNSGHTFYAVGKKVVLKQLPALAVYQARLAGHGVPIYLNGGAVIDVDLLNSEIEEHLLPHNVMGTVMVHPHAALITEEAKKEDAITVRSIASTGQGVGPAMSRKLLRHHGQAKSVVLHRREGDLFCTRQLPLGADHERIWVEVSQGFSLGLHQGFYPHCTSRECTVAQALADACIAPQLLQNVIATYRTYPIRVGSVDNGPDKPIGSSGDCYPDQWEIEWSTIGVEPEMTTVTKRPRRLFTWSPSQFLDSLRVNRPNILFINFMNYLGAGDDDWLKQNVLEPYYNFMGKVPDAVFLGYGPYVIDIQEYIL